MWRCHSLLGSLVCTSARAFARPRAFPSSDTVRTFRILPQTKEEFFAKQNANWLQKRAAGGVIAVILAARFALDSAPSLALRVAVNLAIISLGLLQPNVGRSSSHSPRTPSKSTDTCCFVFASATFAESAFGDKSVSKRWL